MRASAASVDASVPVLTLLLTLEGTEVVVVLFRSWRIRMTVTCELTFVTTWKVVIARFFAERELVLEDRFWCLKEGGDAGRVWLVDRALVDGDSLLFLS